jgi:hypothetical protein
MTRHLTALLVIGSLVAAGSAAASNHTLCVGKGHGCHATIQSAVNAARDGDTIVVGPGTFAGGITIDKSIRLMGAGARQTVIRGGGPVLTIGAFLAPDPPTVTISGVTVTGGRTSSSAVSEEFVGEPNVIAAGGGIEVNPSEDFGEGATVTLKDSVVTGNRAVPTATVPSGAVICPGGDSCPFALAKGGGIDTWGALTLSNTTVTGNTAAGIASDALGGGIAVWNTGALKVVDSRLIGNTARASKPNGRFAEGGAVYTDPGVALTFRDSVVDENRAHLTSDLPYFVEGADPIDMNANGGGIHSAGDADISIRGTSISRNAVSVRDLTGQPYGIASALLTSGDGHVELRDSRIEGNRLVAVVGSSADAGSTGDAIDINGPATISDSLIRGNSVLVVSPHGDAAANGTIYVDRGTEAALIENTVIAGNVSRAVSREGEATVQAAGVLNDGQLRLRDVLIADNVGKAIGESGFAQGGGIWNGALLNEGPSELTLQRTTVTRNRVLASPGLDVAGAGIFTEFPIVFTNSRVVGNSPDQCSGC